jgi:putative flippase GtrA
MLKTGSDFVIIIKDILSRGFIKQLISYFFIGLSAALVEWFSFWLLNEPLEQNIYTSTAIAFILATFVNWIIGRNTIFKKAAKNKKISVDASVVYIVSGIGLGLNLALMWLLADVLAIYPLFSKIIATGLVFMWNFLSRRYFVYKQ